MLAVAVGRGAHEYRCNHQRASHADHAHHVRQHAVVVPLLQSFLARFRKAEVDGGRPILIDAVIPVRGQQFLGAHQPQCVIKIGGRGVLAAFAAVEREQRGARPGAPCFEGQHAAVFVVGMSRNHESGWRAS